MSAMASQITSLTIVYSTVYSDADQRKHQSSASLATLVTGEFPAQMASNAENVSIWWRHHEMDCCQSATKPVPSTMLIYVIDGKILYNIQCDYCPINVSHYHWVIIISDMNIRSKCVISINSIQGI